jgi:phosphatidylserine/phosphatidylglycerophosphate/cardiolipin synthase-like enzyme
VTDLATLTAKYFPASVTPTRVHTGDSELRFIVDGVTFFSTIAADLRALPAAGAFVYLAGWVFDPGVVLPDRGTPPTIGELLAGLNQQGADVRVLLFAGTSGISAARFPCSANRPATAWLLDHGVTNTVLDQTGELLASHHTKAIVIGSHQGSGAGSVVAYLSGMDFGGDRIDDTTHVRIAAKADGSFDQCLAHLADGTPTPAWHDVGIRMSGPAAVDVWENFVCRWNAAAHTYQDPSGERFFSLGPTAPHGPGAVDIDQVLPSPSSSPTLKWVYRYAPDGVAPLDVTKKASLEAGAMPTSGTACAILRSESADKCADWAAAGIQVPTSLTDVQDTLTKAIAAAQKYVYIEDQSFPIWAIKWWLVDATHKLTYPPLIDALKRGVKVICVHGTPDPGDGIQDSAKPAHEMQEDVLDALANVGPPAPLDNFALYKIHCIVVHAKLVIVDDEFMSVGSANFFDRSWTGLDSECNIGIVSDDTSTFVRDARIRLWAEHAGVLPQIQLSSDQTQLDRTSSVYQELLDPDAAVGLWRSSWKTQSFSFDSPSGGPPGPRLLPIYPAAY